MKKFLSLLTALVLVLSLTACGGTSSETSAPGNSLPGRKRHPAPLRGRLSPS